MSTSSAALDVQLVEAGLQKAESYTASARELLQEGLPCLRAVGSEGLHPFQQEFVKLVAACLDEARRSTEAALGDAPARQQEAEQLLESARAAEAAALEALATADGQLQVKEGELAAARETVSREEKELKPLEVLRDAGESQVAALQAQEQEAASLVNSIQQSLAGGAGDGLTADALQLYLRDMRAEETLVAAVGAVLEQPAEKWGLFDKEALTVACQHVGARLSKLQQDCAAAREETKSIRCEALGQWAIAEVARERVKELTAAVQQMKATCAAARKTHGACQAERQSVQENMSQLLVKKTSHEQNLEELAQATAALQRICTPPAPSALPAEPVEGKAAVAPAAVAPAAPAESTEVAEPSVPMQE